MVNDTLDPDKHTTSSWDAFWYRVHGALGTVQRVVIEHCVREPVWRSFDGKVHTPRTMADSHLENAMKLCERRFENESEALPPVYAALAREFKRRGLVPKPTPRWQQRNQVLPDKPWPVAAPAAPKEAPEPPPDTRCMLCGFYGGDKHALKLWSEQLLESWRCTDAKACQNRLISTKLGRKTPWQETHSG